MLLKRPRCLACLIHRFTSTDAALTGKNTEESHENPKHTAKMMLLPLIGPILPEEPLHSSELLTISYWESNLAPTSWLELMI